MHSSTRRRRSYISAITSAVIVAGLVAAAPSAYASENVNATQIVAPMAAALKQTRVPTIAGTVSVGTPLTAKPGTWGTGVALKYQWSAGGTAIKGATSSKFTPTASQVGKKLTVTVTGSKAGYTTVSKTSTSTKAVPALALKAGSATITGTASVGQKLTAKPGSWTTGTALKYQWYVGGVAVAKATSPTYTVRPVDVDRAVTVKVTGTKAGHAAKTAASAATKKVVGKLYANCTLLKKDYPDGIRKTGIKGDTKSGVLKPFKGTPFASNALYAKQSIARDADRDGIMCER